MPGPRLHRARRQLHVTRVRRNDAVADWRRGLEASSRRSHRTLANCRRLRQGNEEGRCRRHSAVLTRARHRSPSSRSLGRHQRVGANVHRSRPEIARTGAR